LVLLVFALAAPASARQFQMSGTWLVRQGHAFLPLQFGGNAGGSQMTHVSMGSWTEAPFFPTGTPDGGMSSLAQVVRDSGVVTATGSAPAVLRIPRSHWKRDHGALIPVHPGGGFGPLQITTMLAVDASYATATLMAGAGPGSFTWCPANPACTIGGPIPGGQPAADNGRVVYAAGANQFGGTMRLGLAGGGFAAIRINFVPLRVAHFPFWGVGTTLRAWATGSGGNDAPQTQLVTLPPCPR
jgi:hypothetical protein